MRELEKQLRVVALVAERPRTNAELREVFSVTRQTIMRMMAELRHLGVDIATEKVRGRYVYRVRNWDTIEPRVRQWLKHEEKQREIVAGGLSEDGQRQMEV